MARDDFNHRASPRNAVRVSVFDVQDLQRCDWWRGEWKLDHLAFDKNWKLHFFAGPTCEPNGNEENAVAAAGRLVFDGIHLVLARGEPVAPGKRGIGKLKYWEGIFPVWRTYQMAQSRGGLVNARS